MNSTEATVKAAQKVGYVPRAENVEDELMRRTGEVSRFIDTNRLGISSQCEFVSALAGNEVDQHSRWRKLELVGQAANRIWPDRS